jgi:hypothetical protein
MKEIIDIIYVYCTDCVINLANMTGLSYYEINFLLFCFLYPILFIATPLLYIVQKHRLTH